MTRFPILLLLCSCVCAPTRPAPPPFKYPNTVDLGDIEPEPLSASVLEFGRLASAGATEITLRIDSQGGAVGLGLTWMRGIEDLKKMRGVRVVCVVDWQADSMAAIILESTVCDQRLATPRAEVMFHDARPLDEHPTPLILEYVMAHNDDLALIASQRIGIPIERYRALSLDTWVLSARMALEANVIDGIVSPNDVAPPERP